MKKITLQREQTAYKCKRQETFFFHCKYAFAQINNKKVGMFYTRWLYSQNIICCSNMSQDHKTSQK